MKINRHLTGVFASLIVLGLSLQAQAHTAHTSRVEISIEADGPSATVVVDQYIPGNLLSSVTGQDKRMDEELNMIAGNWVLLAGGKQCQRSGLQFIDTDHEGLYRAKSSYNCNAHLDPLKIDFNWLKDAPAQHHVNTKLRLKGKQKWLVIEQNRPSLTIDVASIKAKWVGKR